MTKANMVDKNCKSTVYITPERIMKPVRDYFGGQIVLAPATEPSNPQNAKEFCTGAPESDGLAISWVNGTFINPPYGKLLRPFLEKIHEEAEDGHEIIALLPASRWEQFYWQRDVFNPNLTGLCFVRKRVNFLRPTGEVAQGNPHGSIVCLYNGMWSPFRKHFGDIGFCTRFTNIEWRVKD